MTTILYPTRGGQSSYENQDRVIALAKELDAELIFLYVSNVEFLGSVARPALLDLIEDELDHMGEFLLAMAQERATNAGWHADAEVRRGNFREALDAVISERNVDVLALGAPGKNQAMTTTKFLQNMMEAIVKDFGIRVIVIGDGEIVETTEPQG